jgi:hypothetical protein
MQWKIDEQGRLVITVTKKEQRSLQAVMGLDEVGECELPFDSDAFLSELLEPMVTNDEYVWLHGGCTDDLTDAPMLGVLGEEIPGPDNLDDAIGLGLYHVGCWHHRGRLRQMYHPVLKRWAFMDYQITSPQKQLAETGECVWEGGDL